MYTATARINRVWLYFSLALLVGAAACGGDDDPESSIRVGLILPFTGPLEIHGEPIEVAVILAQQEINNAGGVLGEPLELVTKDTGTEPSIGVAATKALVEEEGTDILLGPISSSVLLEMLPYTVERNVLVLSGGPTSTEFTDYEDNDLFLRTVPTVQRVAEVLAEQAYNQDGSRTAAVVLAENSYTTTLGNTFADKFEELGGTVQVYLNVPDDPEDGRDFQKDFSDITADNPDTVFLSTWPEYGVNFIKIALAESSSTIFLGSDSLNDEVTVGSELGTDAPVLKGTSFAPIDNQSSSYFAQKFGAALDGRTPSPRTREMYDATLILALAMTKANSTDPLAVRDAVREVANPPGTKVYADEYARARDLLLAGEDIDYVGAAGEVDIDENGDTHAAIEIWSYNDAGEGIVLGTVAE